MVNEHAKEILLQNELSQFLKLCFEVPPLLFQSLSFIKGSNQGIHQDTAYVVTDQPMKLIASWIALEDINPGSGELEFYPQSHRYDEFLFLVNISIFLLVEMVTKSIKDLRFT